MRRRLLVVGAAVCCLLVGGLGDSARSLRREFFPEVDAGAFEMYVRAPIRHAD